MTAARDLYARHALDLTLQALGDTRVVALNGARQSGKSTLARLVAAQYPHSVVRFLDDPAVLRAAQDDPVGFVDQEGLLVIDEVQLAPELFRTIKLVVDADPRPGRFLLTGSAQLLALRDLPDALPGRMEIIELAPLSQGELTGTPDGFVDAAFAHGTGLTRTSPHRKRDYLELAVRGGFPEAVHRTDARRPAFFESYVTNLIERDVRLLVEIDRRRDLRQLIGALAGRTAGLVVPARLSADTGLPRATLTRYLELLAAVFLIKEIPAWSAGNGARVTRAGKLMFVDTGIAAHLLGQDVARLGEPGGVAGPLLETFVLSELQRQLSWSRQRARLYHYRTRDGQEVDAVLEAPDGRVVAVEVKAGATVRSEDLRGLRHLQARLADRFVAGYVLYTGQQTLPYGDRLRALPLDALWECAP